MNNLKLKRCEKCGSIVLELKECECNECLTCCGVSMKEINASNEEVNKHIPSYYRQDNKLIIRVNHEQEENHYIVIEMSNLHFNLFRLLRSTK